MKYLAEIDGDRIDVSVDTSRWPEIAATIDGRTHRLHLTEIGPGAYWLVDDGRSVEIALTRTPSGYSVRIGPDPVEIALITASGPDAASPGRRDGPAEVRAPMPGKVVAVLVEAGAAVEAGQGLVVVEAMKMQNEMTAPRAGVVQQIRVTPGAAVGAGDVLAVLE